MPSKLNITTLLEKHPVPYNLDVLFKHTQCASLQYIQIQRLEVARELQFNAYVANKALATFR